MAKDKKPSIFSKLHPIITLLVGSALGSGFVWQWQQNRLDRAKYDLEIMARSMEIREKIESNVVKILGFHKKHYDILAEIDKDANKSKKDELKSELHRMWKIEFPLITNNITHLENMLSKLEDREPRKFDFVIPPAAPANFRISIIEK